MSSWLEFLRPPHINNIHLLLNKYSVQEIALEERDLKNKETMISVLDQIGEVVEAVAD